MESLSAFGFFMAASQVALGVVVLPPLALALFGWLRERRKERQVSLPRGASIAR